MNTITFDTEKAKRVESLVCCEFGCAISEIVSFRDSIFKKVVVFLLSKLYGYDKRMIGHKYQMTYLYVPTAISEIEDYIKMKSGFETKINSILKQIDNEKILDPKRIRHSFEAVS